MGTAGTLPRSVRTDTTGLFRLFSALFALSLILHQLWWNSFELLTPHAAVILAAAWALLRPTSVGRFLLAVGAEVVAVALDMPFVGSHTLLVLIVGGCVLAQLGWLTVRARRLPSPAAAFDTIAPFLRVAVIVVYATAAVAKLNSGFLDPVTSCAASMSRQVAWFDPALLDGSWRIEPAIWGTVATEVALPVLLAVRRTRLLGVVVGVGFHVVLALAGNVPFTALAFALYVAFLPRDLPIGLPRVGRPLRAAVLAGAVVAWLTGAALSVTDPGLVGVLIADGTRLVVVLVACGGLGALLVLRRGAPDPPEYPPHSLRVREPVLAVGVALLIVNGMSPYLGLQTDSSFEMFSNLRTEPGAWNHLLVPEAVRIFGYQDRPVRVVASNDPALTTRGGGATAVLRFELERYLREHPGTVAAALAPGDAAPRTLGPLPPGPTPAERIAVFRDVPPPGTPRC